jgi:hypothetical protein
MAKASRNRTPSWFSPAELSVSSVNSQKLSLDIANCVPSMARYCGRSIRDPSFSFSLARISLGLSFPELKLDLFERRYLRQRGK